MCEEGSESRKCKAFVVFLLVSTKVPCKIQLLLLTTCTCNGLPKTLEVQNRDVKKPDR